MDIKTALALADKDAGKKIQLVLESHGYSDHTQDVKLMFADFIMDANLFTQKENMPKVWKSDSSLAQGFDALRLFIEIQEIKTHLIESFGQSKYDTLHSNIYDLKKKHQRMAKNKIKPDNHIVTEPVQQVDNTQNEVVQAPNQEEPEDSDTNTDSTDDESISTESEVTWSQEDINAIIVQNDCALKFIWDLAVSEQDPFKKITLQNLHRSIKAIGPLYKQRSSPSSS